MFCSDEDTRIWFAERSVLYRQMANCPTNNYSLFLLTLLLIFRYIEVFSTDFTAFVALLHDPLIDRRRAGSAAEVGEVEACVTNTQTD